MAEEHEFVQMKIRKDLLELFRELYKLPKTTKYKDVYLYAIASSLPQQGKDHFVKDYNLDSHVLDRITQSRSRITKEDIDPKLSNLNDKLNKILHEQQMARQKQKEDDAVLLSYIKLLLYDNAFTTPVEDLKDILNNKSVDSMEHEVRNIVKGE
ncbi:hypothetical protein BS756_00670 [Staphylococcus sp. MB371]|nr:hypothetical protein BS756_00670 [Staphylococcus sp. MB371]